MQEIPAETIQRARVVVDSRAAALAESGDLIKPIQGALQGIAYLDDRVVKDVTGNWRDINGRFPVRYMSLPLASAFSDGREFVHVRLWVAPREEELG